MTYDGEKYLFFHHTDERTKSTVCALVPIHVVIDQAESIKQLTIAGVLLCGIIAVVIGLVIKRHPQEYASYFRKP